MDPVTSPPDDRDEQLLLAHHAAASPGLRYSAIHPVHIDGWLAKEGKALRSRRTRYLRLNAHILSSHRSKSAPPSWQISVADAVVERGDHPREIKISLPHRSLSLVAPSNHAFDAWIVALRRASAVSTRVDDYYTIGRLIGEGMNGQVRVAQDMLTDETVAIKMVPRLGRENETQFLARELQIILSISHPNIVNTIDVFVSRRRIHFVMEYLAGGELFDFIAENTHFTEAHAATVMVDLLTALSYLHARGIAHRDVKLENLLCTNTTWPLNVKLADFGFANYVNSGNEPMLSSFVGTPYYIAPEMLRADLHGRPVDIWASGVVLYILLSGKFPFGGKNESEYYQRVLCKEAYFPSEEWSNVSEQAKDLVRGMLCKDPQKRLTSDQCLRHAWLKGAVVEATPVAEAPHEEVFPCEVATTPHNETLLTSPAVFRSHRDKRGHWRQVGMLNHSLTRGAEYVIDPHVVPPPTRKDCRTELPAGARVTPIVHTTDGAAVGLAETATANRRPSLIRRLLSSGKLSLDRYEGRFPSFRGSVEEADEATATPRKTLSLFSKDGPLRRSFHRVGERFVENRAGMAGIGGGVLDGGINFVNSQSQRLPPKVARERMRLQKQQAEANRKGRGVGVSILTNHRKWAGGGAAGSGDNGGSRLANGAVYQGHQAMHSASRLHATVAPQAVGMVPSLEADSAHMAAAGMGERNWQEQQRRNLEAVKRYDNDVLEFASVVHNVRRETDSSLEEDAIRRTVSADVALAEGLVAGSGRHRDVVARHDDDAMGRGMNAFVSGNLMKAATIRS